jgi:hypothetical protein
MTEMESSAATAQYNYWDFAGALTPYYSYFGRKGPSTAVSPGFLKLGRDAGQFALLDHLYQRQVAAGDCQSASETWEILQRELRGGEWYQGLYPQMPACS